MSSSTSENKLKEIRSFVEQVKRSNSYTCLVDFQVDTSTTPSTSTTLQEETMANPVNQLQHPQQEMTMLEYAAPKAIDQPLCIQIASPYELKPGLIQILPTFNGLAGECPHKHLRKLKVVCATAPSDGTRATPQQILLKAFPFSLAGAATDWLYSLPSSSVGTWEEMEQLFLEQYFPASRTYSIRNEIANIEQGVDETLYEYWTRFNKLVDSCPHHRIEDQKLMTHFVDGLTYHERGLLNAASGGLIMGQGPTVAREVIKKMAKDSQQCGKRNKKPGVHAIHTSSQNTLELKFTEIADLLKAQASLTQPKIMRNCGICNQTDHYMEACPTLQSGEMEDCNMINQANPQRRYDPYSSTYNPGWRDHPAFKYGNQNNFQNSKAPLHKGSHSPNKMLVTQHLSRVPQALVLLIQILNHILLNYRGCRWNLRKCKWKLREDMKKISSNIQLSCTLLILQLRN